MPYRTGSRSNSNHYESRDPRSAGRGRRNDRRGPQQGRRQFVRETLPTDAEELKTLINANKTRGKYNNIAHLKTYHKLDELGALFFSDQNKFVIGGPTGSGKTIGSAALMANILDCYESSNVHTVYMSIPLIKGVTMAYDYLSKQILNHHQKRKVGFAAGGSVKYRDNQPVRICTTGHVFNRLAHMLKDPHNRNKLNNMLVLIDEAHTPSIENYLLICLCLYIQRKGYNLRVGIMSATLDSAPLLDEFEDAPNLELEGHLYDTETVYLDRDPFDDKDLMRVAAQKIVEHAAEERNILCFVAGEKQINQLSKALASYDNMDVCGLISNMPKEEQQRAFEPAEHGKVKVVIATNIAESSVTIEGMDVAIDTGREIKAKLAPSGRAQIYGERVIPQASAEQRAGRVGRVKPGINVRLWTRDFEEFHMKKHSESDFYSLNPDTQVLRLISLELDSMEITRLSEARHTNIIDRLEALRLITCDDGDELPTITALGLEVLKFQASLDTSVVMAHLSHHDNETVKVIGTNIMSLIEGCNGYLPFWVGGDKRAELSQVGYDDNDFGDFLGEDDIETLFLILFGTEGLFQSFSWGDDVFQNRKGYGPFTRARSKWCKAHSMNNKLVKNSMRLFTQFFSAMYPRRKFGVTEIDALYGIEDIFDPNNYALIEYVLDEVRKCIAMAFPGERYKSATVRAGRMGYETGYRDVQGYSYAFDKRRSYCRMMRKDKLPDAFPFNISITKKGKRFISAVVLDPTSRDAIADKQMTMEEYYAAQAYGAAPGGTAVTTSTMSSGDNSSGDDSWW